MKNQNFFQKIKNFLFEIKTEIKKVNWPRRGETLKYTLIVIFISLIVAIYLGALDYIYIWIFQKLIF